MRVDPTAVVVTRGDVALPPPVAASHRLEPTMQLDTALQLAEHPIDRGTRAMVGKEGEDPVAHELDPRKGFEKSLELGGEGGVTTARRRSGELEMPVPEFPRAPAEAARSPRAPAPPPVRAPQRARMRGLARASGARNASTTRFGPRTTVRTVHE